MNSKESFITNTLETNKSLPGDLQIAQELVYAQCNWVVKDVHINDESKEYGACTFKLNEKSIVHRCAKITPSKTGQFVTIWKRNENGETAPFDSLDDLDYIIVSTRSGDKLGQFVFPKRVLVDKQIITHEGKEGKRGMRVYPPWDKTTSKQAAATQQWQAPYFLIINKWTEPEAVKMIFGVVAI